MRTYPENNIFSFMILFLNCAVSYLATAYVYCNSLIIKLNKIQWLYLLSSSIALSVVFVVVRFQDVSLAHLMRYIIISLLLGFLSKDFINYKKAIVIAYISFAFVIVSEAISSIITGTLFWLFGIVSDGFIENLFVNIQTVALCICLMKVKRFRNGFQFFQDDKNLGLGLALSGIVMLLKCMNLQDNQDVDYMFFIFIVGILIMGFGLYLWIRRSITAHYRERLQLKSEEHYKEMLEERDKELEKLSQSNEYLAKIVHRDNHLMSALDSSINAYFNSTDEIEKDNLLHEIHTLAKERGKLIAKEQLESKLLPTTGNLLIDGSINDLYIKAAAHGIDFNLTVSVTVDGIIGKYISQTDLQTLLSDHIKDAIIAVDNRGEAGGRILVNLSMQNNNYCIDIYDNGVEFSIDTLSKLGLERVTTHADTGGSGIGFMTTFETLKKAYASLVITEFENKTPFSKSVTFRFDGENAYIIHSYRSEELKKNINRADLVIDN